MEMNSMSPKISPKPNVQAVPNDSFDHRGSFAGLKTSFSPFKPARIDKKNTSDYLLSKIVSLTTDFAHEKKGENSDPDRFSKFIETFPCIIKDMLGADFNVYKTGQVLDVGYGIDVLFKFKDGAAFGLDMTTNILKSSSPHMSEKKYSKIDVLEEENDEENKEESGKNNSYHNIFKSIVLPIREEDFLLDFHNMFKVLKLSLKNTYLFLLKKYYMDPIYVLLTLKLTGDRISDFDKLRNLILDPENGKNAMLYYFGFNSIENIDNEKKYMLDILLHLYTDFYENPEVLKLKDVLV